MSKITVYTEQGKKIELNENDEIQRGGEGRIILIPNNDKDVAKIYHQGIEPITVSQFRFLTKINNPAFVTPKELYFYKNKVVAGFSMEYISNDYFPLAVIFSKNYCTKNGITEKLKTKIINTLIDALSYVHAQNIVIGDFNQYNILVNHKGEVKFIDTDSYETPAHQHSGLLLEDIRDYLHGGDVCVNSDFFALSILAFY